MAHTQLCVVGEENTIWARLGYNVIAESGSLAALFVFVFVT